MENHDWYKQINEVYRSLDNQHLKNALDLLGAWSKDLQNWHINEKLNELNTTYKAMLYFIAEGAQDPGRDKVYHDLLRSTYQLAGYVLNQFLIRHSSEYHINKRRNLPVTDDHVLLEDLLNALGDISSRQALQSLLDEGEYTRESQYQDVCKSENLVNEIFDYIRLNSELSNPEKELLERTFADRTLPYFSQCLIITALTFALQDIFDENKVELLLQAAEHENEEIRQRAIVGILIVLRQYDKRMYLYPHIINRLEYLSENDNFVKSIRNILLLFILSKDTEKITRKITEEILPEMMKINPVLGRKIKLDDLLSESDTDEKNPEWKSILEESGLGDKLREFSQMQMDGADVMHSSFAHLKSFPFFNRMSFWFFPFYENNSTFFEMAQGEEPQQIARAIMSFPVLCNSDKYSFCLSLKNMPENMMKVVTAQFSEENTALLEMKKTELPDNEKKAKDIANQYIRDLYRFYKLHPYRKEFRDIFEDKTEFYQVKSIEGIVYSDENLRMIGEYYFSRNYYEYAADIFDRILVSDPGNDVLFQKKGYSLQMLGDIRSALDNYLKADLINNSNSWTIKKIAYCYRYLKMPEEALSYYRKAEQLNPDNLGIQMNIGHCYLEQKNYQEALKYYFKVYYLDTNSHKAWRPVAWCSFLTGKYDQALEYYRKILDSNPDSSDYLNVGHTLLVTGNVKEAMDNYVLSVKKNGGFFEKFRDAFQADIPELVNAGFDAQNTKFVLDLIQYNIG